MKVSFEQLQSEFLRILLKNGFTPEKAKQCAAIFAENSRDGIYTHGLNRFPGFIEYVHDGLVVPDAGPVLFNTLGLIEQWDGNLGPGMLNATFCMDRAIALAKQHGIGCVAIRNTNHWMRGGTYGWQAAQAGCIGICFTNTIANMPPWGGIDPRLGNNPLVIAVPKQGGHMVLDMAMSQYAYGKLQQYAANNNEALPLPGGYDSDGKLSTDANAILKSNRMLPAGFWKGSGLTLMLDVLATILSRGNATQAITESSKESGVSQVFICLYEPDASLISQITNQITNYIKTSRPDTIEGDVSYPGENTLKTRLRNLKEGIPVNEAIWNKILSL